MVRDTKKRISGNDRHVQAQRGEYHREDAAIRNNEAKDQHDAAHNETICGGLIFARSR